MEQFQDPRAIERLQVKQHDLLSEPPKDEKDNAEKETLQVVDPIEIGANGPTVVVAGDEDDTIEVVSFDEDDESDGSSQDQ